MSRSRAPSKPDRSLSGGFNRAMILRLGLAVVWLPGFALWFYSFGLPNNRPAERWMIWSRIPFDLMDLLDPPVIDGSAPWSWFYLADRLPFFGLALLVWVTSVCLGRTELRVLRLWTCFDRMERLFFAACLGLASTSLLVLGLGLAGIVQGGALLLIVLGICGVELQKTWRERRLPGDRRPSVSKSSGAVPSFLESEPANVGLLWIRRGVVWTLVPFVFCLLLGAMSPQTDFDVVEYHLGGPKEWFLMGRISRLPHNVYTSFPFLTEMLILSGMELSGDWYWGALAGQAIIAGFAPLTAVGLLATGKRWFSPAAGRLAALVWLTTPWAYRISIIAYAEGGLACYLFAAFAVGLRLIWDHPSARENPEEHSVGDRIPITMYGLCGFLAGSAMACKYTGLISAVLPVGVMLFGSLVAALQKTPRASGSPGQAAGNERSVFAAMSAYSVGVLVAIGPWMAKNLMETGNPVFPLAYSLFGGEGRDAAMDYQWRMAHSSHYDSIWAILVDFPVKLTDVVANNDWHSALMFGLAPIAILANWRRKIWFIWAFVGWQFLSWFLFTHHIDRFYVPLFPVVGLAAGCGAAWLLESSLGRWAGIPLIAATVLFNACIMMHIGGFNAGRLELSAASDIATPRSQRWLNQEFAEGRLPAEFKTLCVGEAALFHARFPYLYNTVFDRSLFEQWCAVRSASGDFDLQPADEIRRTLRQHGVTHVLVNWSEILRYREPGSYGYTDFAHPEMFSRLQKAGVLGPPLSLPDPVSFVPVMEQSKSAQIHKWAPSLEISIADQPGIRAVEIFPVLP